MDALNLLMSYAIRDYVGKVAKETDDIFIQIIEKDMKKEGKQKATEEVMQETEVCGGYVVKGPKLSDNSKLHGMSVFNTSNQKYQVMTNEERAKEILNAHNSLGIFKVGSIRELVAIDCIVAALNEKDQQFKEYLEKKREDADDCDDNITSCVITEIINELFKQ